MERFDFLSQNNGQYNDNLSETSLANLINQTDFTDMYEKADAVRKSHKGNVVKQYGQIELSNHCSKNCMFCLRQVSNTALRRSRLSLDELAQAIGRASEAGFRELVLTSGDDPNVVDLLYEIMPQLSILPIQITLDIGLRPIEVYQKLRFMGAKGIILRQQVSDEKTFSLLHDKDSLSKRTKLLVNCRELGYRIGSGFTVGLTYQTTRILAENLVALRALSCDMMFIDCFEPNANVPQAGRLSGSSEITRRIVALCRILLPDSTLFVPSLPIRTEIQKQQKACFAYGANALMQKLDGEEEQDFIANCEFIQEHARTL